MEQLKLKTRDLTDVEILDVGTWDASTGPVKITEAFADELVQNTNELISLGLLQPPAKLGHPKNQKLLQQEGWPAAGWIRNLRRDGTKIVADVAKVPQKLADLIEAGGYRKISSEFWKSFGKVGGKGKSYGPVLTAIAFLGEELPAVSTLDDMIALFGSGLQPAVVKLSSGRGDTTRVELEKKTKADEDLEADDLIAAAEKFAERAAERTKGHKGAPRLRAFLDEVRRRVRDIVSKVDGSLGDDESLQERRRKIDEVLRKRYGYSTWVMETYDTYAIVDREGRYYQVDYAIAENGDVTLGAETEVQRSWKVAAAAVKHTFDVAGGEPEWSDVDAAELPQQAFAIAEGDDVSGWQLAHHFERDGALHAHAGGIRAALAALAGLKGVSKEALASARAHLEDHAQRAGIGDEKTKEADMANKAVIAALGLPEDADDAAVVAEIGKLKATAEKASTTETTVQELKAAEDERKATEKVEAAIRDRKIRPAEKTFWVELAKEKPEQFDKHVKDLPALFSGEKGTATDAPEASASEQIHKLANERVAEAAKTGAKLSIREAVAQVTAEQPELARQVRAERRKPAAVAS